MALDSSDNVYMTGGSYSDYSDYDYLTVKFNSSGDVEWSAYYNGTGNGEDCTTAICTDLSGNVYVTGYSYASSSYDNYDYVTVKYNSQGVEQWAAKYNGTGNSYDRAVDIIADNSGNIYVTGVSSGAETYWDFVTICYDPSGTQKWIATYDSGDKKSDYPEAIAIDRSHNIFVTGWSEGFYPPNPILSVQDFTTVKYDSNGLEQWIAHYDDPDHREDVAKAIVVDDYGNAYITGDSYDSTAWDNYTTIKYDPSGNLKWMVFYDSPDNGLDYANDIEIQTS